MKIIHTFQMKMMKKKTRIKKINKYNASENKSHKTMNLLHSSVILSFQLTNICIAFVYLLRFFRSYVRVLSVCVCFVLLLLSSADALS